MGSTVPRAGNSGEPLLLLCLKGQGKEAGARPKERGYPGGGICKEQRPLVNG